MANENLKQLMDRLDKELKETKVIDEAAREKLAKLKEDISRKLDRPEGEKHPEGLIGRLKDAALSLEARYPSLTLLLNEISDSLSRMGI